MAVTISCGNEFSNRLPHFDASFYIGGGIKWDFTIEKK
jgi:hypothetical protein